MNHCSEMTDAVAATSRPATADEEQHAGVSTVLALLASQFEQRGASEGLQGIFEEAVQKLVAARAVHLREPGSPLGPRSPGAEPPTAESIVLDVPMGDPARRVQLEARFDEDCTPDAWDLQALQSAAHLAPLVLEADRARLLSAFGSGARRRPDGAAPLIGSSGVMQTLRERIERVASTDFTALIEGESGVGKELVARQIHELSRRRHGPFIAINCAAIVESLLEAELFGIEDRTATGVRGRRGKFEHADGGTLFLDEVSDLSVSAQAKLLRAIQDLAVERVGGLGIRRIDIRIVAATNRSLSEMVDRGLFRSDLFYRLGGVEIRVPPLRSRREDILELARYFLARHRQTRRLDLAPAAADALLAYEWPGNVRELERLMEYAVALAESDRIELDDLPTAIRGEYGRILGPSLAADETMRTWGSRYARLVLERCGSNKRQACRVLGITYHTLQAYLRHAEQVNARRSPMPSPIGGAAVGT